MNDVPNAQGAPPPSTAAQPGANPADNANGANPPNEAPQATPRGLKGSGLRYGVEDGVPSWAVGKNADEILKMTQDLYGAMQNGGAPAQAPPPPPQAPTAPLGHSVDPNLMYSDPARYTQELLAEAERRAEARLTSASGSVVTPLASMAKMHAKTHRPDVWDSYAPEIEALMARVQAPHNANIDLWREAVDIVAGRHVDDIARRKADEIMRRGGDTGSLTPGGSPPTNGASGASPIRKLLSDRPDLKEYYKDAGITAEMLVTQGVKMGHDESKYADMLSRKARAVLVGA